MNPKYPELSAMLTVLKAERSQLTDKSLPLRAERDRLLKSIQPTLDKIRKLEEQYLSIERPRMSELDNQISALHRTMGAKTLTVTSPETTTTGA